MVGILIIDGQGVVHDHRSAALWSSIGCEPTTTEVLVRSLGFIAIDMRRRVPRVQLRPDIVARLALGGLTRLLLNGRISRMLLAVDGGSDVDELCPTSDMALVSLSALITQTHRKRVEGFEAVTIEADRLALTNPMAEVLRSWHGHRIDIDQLLPLLSRGFQQRFMIVQHDLESDRLHFRSLGRGYSIFDKKWSAIAAGQLVEDQYDTHYGQWTARGYRAASLHMHPLIQRIEAVIDKPRCGLRRERYVRMIVPFNADGRRLLLSVSDTNLTSVDVSRS